MAVFGSKSDSEGCLQRVSLCAQSFDIALSLRDETGNVFLVFLAVWSGLLVLAHECSVVPQVACGILHGLIFELVDIGAEGN